MALKKYNIENFRLIMQDYFMIFLQNQHDQHSSKALFLTRVCGITGDASARRLRVMGSILGQTPRHS